MLTFEEYCQLAARTAPQDDLVNAAYGLLGEGGEIADLIKKSRYQGHALDVTKLQEEIGDALWYVAMAARFEGLTNDDHGLWRRQHQTADGRHINDALWDYFDAVTDMLYTMSASYIILDGIFLGLSTIARAHNLTLEQCAVANIEKLRKRYPQGFSAEASINREA